MRAMILAAGLGTRLRPITESLPKSLVPVAGVPNIVRAISVLRGVGIREIVINTCHLAEILEDTLGDGARYDVEIAYSREEELLGTGGGIRKALPLLGEETFIVVNGDALFVPNIERVLAMHRKKRALATLIVREDSRAEAYGAVGLDGDDRIRRLVWAGETERVVRNCIFTGFHVIEPEISDRLPEMGCIVRETYIPALEQGVPLFGMTTRAPCFDLGTPKRYLEANIAVVTGKISLDGYNPSREGVHIGQGVTVGKDCHLGPGVILCDDVSVASGVHLERVVVLPGGRVETNLSDVIVLSNGQLLDAN
ncbi:MAG: NDP-sugar synthase [Deltaproteobacteria bacterium]|nr:NDP-sugar synthase [Deltaproteobacteria bacterium]